MASTQDKVARWCTATHEMGHAAAFWHYGEIVEGELWSSEEGHVGFYEPRPGFEARYEDGDPLTRDQQIICSLAGAAAEYWLVHRDFDQASDHAESDLSDLDALHWDWNVDGDPFECKQFDVAGQLVRKYKREILSGARLLMKQDKFSAADVVAIFCEAARKRRKIKDAVRVPNAIEQ